MSHPVLIRPLARADIEDAVERLLTEATHAAAASFIDDFERVVGTLGAFPSSGSPGPAIQLGFPGLRGLLLPRHPYFVFHLVAKDAQVDILRVLHTHRDIGEALRATLLDSD